MSVVGCALSVWKKMTWLFGPIHKRKELGGLDLDHWRCQRHDVFGNHWRCQRHDGASLCCWWWSQACTSFHYWLQCFSAAVPWRAACLNIVCVGDSNLIWWTVCHYFFSCIPTLLIWFLVVCDKFGSVCIYISATRSNPKFPSGCVTMRNHFQVIGNPGQIPGANLSGGRYASLLTRLETALCCFLSWRMLKDSAQSKVTVKFHWPLFWNSCGKIFRATGSLIIAFTIPSISVCRITGSEFISLEGSLHLHHMCSVILPL